MFFPRILVKIGNKEIGRTAAHDGEKHKPASARADGYQRSGSHSLGKHRQLPHGNLPQALQALFESRNTTKSALAKAAGISEVYLHQVFSGHRSPSRNRVLCLCIGLQASVEETQSLLVQAHHAPLYPRDQRDAILIYGLSHGLTLPEVNNALFEIKAETLC